MQCARRLVLAVTVMSICPGCTDKKPGPNDAGDGDAGHVECYTDIDCPYPDVCIENECVHSGPDGGPLDGADAADGTDGLACDQADCSEEGLPGRGEDGDGDLWGICCDCDDTDEEVHPLRSEVIYNGKDDDCDPSTLDSDCVYVDDCDGDGIPGPAHGGDDCDDSNPRTHPGATELCDGIDNDCDGSIDDGLWPDCPYGCANIAGDYRLESDCPPLPSGPAQVTQQGCQLILTFGEQECTGETQSDGQLILNCASADQPCVAQIEIGASIDLVCGQECRFSLEPD